MEPVFFAAQKDFRKWLEKNHKKADELLVGFWKVGSGNPSMTWSESVDQALCFGWIDGIRKRLDDEAYTIRFTPRRPNSIWSKINIEKVAVLETKGLMKPTGLAAFEKRKDDRSVIYSYENEAEDLDGASTREFKRNKHAWKFFMEQPPGYRKLMIHRIVSAKQKETREKRLQSLIAASREGKRL